MRVKSCVVIVASALVVAMVVPGMASAHGTHVTAKMSGSEVVGQPGAPNGKGRTYLHILRKKQKVRFKVNYSKIGGKAGMNIGVYSGKQGKDGKLEFTLANRPSGSPVKGIATGVPINTLQQLTRSPHRFHVTLKNDSYPVDGAIRGQLKA
jgi:hypothetical protein